MKKKKCAGILLAISMFISGGCTENRQEDTEIRKPVTIRILAGLSTTYSGTDDMIEDAVTERFPQVELQWECVDWGEDFFDRMRARLSSGDVPDMREQRNIDKSMRSSAQARISRKGSMRA